MKNSNERKTGERNGLHRTLDHADRFLAEVRAEVERSVRRGEDTPPKLRSVHERQGHASPEFRTKVIALPDGGVIDFPDYLARVIRRFTAEHSPDRLLLALEAVQADGQVLFAEARDREGNRRFRRSGFRVNERIVEWDDDDGWVDPGEDAMILDEAF